MALQARRATLSWIFVGALFLVCGVLGVLQYRWIGEVSVAEHDRLQRSLQANLARLSRDFNRELTAACRALLPEDREPGDAAAETDFRARYDRWKAGARGPLFRRILLAEARADPIALREFDLQNESFTAAGWPPEWHALRERMESRLRPGPHFGPRPPEPAAAEEAFVFDFPLLRRFGGGPPLAPGGRESGWIIFEINAAYVRETLLPELVQRHLGEEGRLDYDVEVVTRSRAPVVIYRSDAGAQRIGETADASALLFEPQFEPDFRREKGPGRASGRGPNGIFGRWQINVRHRAGSLEAVVAGLRRRNLAAAAGMLLLIAASAAALLRYTRRAQRLATLEMDFVAGVSHELRTPLTVIHTAAYNLRGAVARNPSQVERYGALIQQESGRLKELVEQILQFARARKGRVIQEREPLEMAAVIERTLQAAQATMQGARCAVEKSVAPDLPRILGDPVALQHALENLLGNAAKYGTDGSNWIGIFAARAADNDQVVEIRVADRGPGIPPEEQKQIFDPFFRGRRALQDQVHGTGLGLSLVKDIVEAHGGTVAVRSGPDRGTEFVLRIPAAPAEHRDEFAHSAG